MNIQNNKTFSACPHDCPSVCAVDVEVDELGKISRLRGAPDNSYTDGVICAKVARYSERLYHPDRLMKPRLRKGEKGHGEWQEIGFDDALDVIAEKFIQIEQAYGSEAIWPYFYAGTMGLIQRDSILRLTHHKKYSKEFGTICINPAWTGFGMATGAIMGPDPREMALSDCVVIWGTNPVSTQVNVMTHAVKARKTRGAKIVVVDIYDNPTMKQADMKIILKPGTDGALACALMHILFRDGLADWDYLHRFSDDPTGLEAHLKDKTPQWASAITGLSVDQIEAFAKLIGHTKKTYFRLGYGFTRQRNGAVNMHAACSIATVLGAWQYEGGGAFHNNGDMFQIDSSFVKGKSSDDPNIRTLDQSKIGRVLTGDPNELYGGPNVHAMLIQNTNPMNVAPEQRLVREGFLRDDLFVAVHEQFMTDTAKLADIILPATMFLEHDDIYKGGGQSHLLLGPKVTDPPSHQNGPRENIDVINGLAKRLGLGDRPDYQMSAKEHIDRMLKDSHLGSYESLKEEKWLDLQQNFDDAHYLGGFAHKDGKFRFKADWQGTQLPTTPPDSMGLMGPIQALPTFPDHVELIEQPDEAHPFQLATSPARAFLNSSFSETPSSLKQERHRPELHIHPDDAADYGIDDGDLVTIGNARGEVSLHARLVDGARRGTLIQEGLWPNSAFINGEGINTLTGADSVPPFGGVAFHDNRVSLKRG